LLSVAYAEVVGELDFKIYSIIYQGGNFSPKEHHLQQRIGNILWPGFTTRTNEYRETGKQGEVSDGYGKPRDYWVRSTRKRPDRRYATKPIVGFLHGKTELNGGWGQIGVPRLSWIELCHPKLDRHLPTPLYDNRSRCP
jgi:hypothetical protein